MTGRSLVFSLFSKTLLLVRRDHLVLSLVSLLLEDCERSGVPLRLPLFGVPQFFGSFFVVLGRRGGGGLLHLENPDLPRRYSLSKRGGRRGGWLRLDDSLDKPPPPRRPGWVRPVSPHLLHKVGSPGRRWVSCGAARRWRWRRRGWDSHPLPLKKIQRDTESLNLRLETRFIHLNLKGLFDLKRLK